MTFSIFEKLLVVVVVLTLGVSFSFVLLYEEPGTVPGPGPITVELDPVEKFASCDEMKKFIETSSERTPYEYYYGMDMAGGLVRTAVAQSETTTAAAPSAAAGADDYSTTNIQVEGVDEADIVKNDGK